MFQFTEAGGIPGVFYSPGRDLGHCGLPYIGYAIQEMELQLKDENAPIYGIMRTLNVTKEELEAGIMSFIKALSEQVKSGSSEFLENDSFVNVRIPVRALIYLYIAPVFIGTSIKGFKDVQSGKTIKELDEQAFREKALKYISFFQPADALSQ